MDFILGLIACALAILGGVFLAKRQARSFNVTTRANQIKVAKGEFPDVYFSDYGDMRLLYLGSPWIQGSMRRSNPFEIHLEYVQRMMAWLLFVDLNQVRQLHAMQLGLGAASLTKFCHQLGIQTTAIEINPKVIETCRLSFFLPHDDSKLQVIQADAAKVVKDTVWHRKIDVLQIDLYDHEAARPVLDDTDFYNDCRLMLTRDGCMVVNLYGHASNYDESLKKITTVFGQEAVWVFKPTKSGNTIALAFQQPRTVDTQTLRSNAEIIQTNWGLPATKWLKALAPAADR